MDIKRFDDLDVFTEEEESLIRDLFQDLDDEWNFQNLRDSRSRTRINYWYYKGRFVGYNGGGFDPPILVNSQHILIINRISAGYFLSYYFDLSGPNDFYTIRIKFLNGLEAMSKRIQILGFNSEILRDPNDTNKFVLYITK